MVVTAGALVAASLVAGMISTGWEAHVAEGRGREAIRQRNRADSEAAVARDARRAAESSAQEAKKSEAKAIDSLGSLQRAQADLQKSLDLQKGLTREARIKELIADAAQWQAADPALALYLGLFVAQAGRPLPSGLEDILSTSLENRPSYAVLRDRGVNALTWSPDGKSLATNGAEGLRVWDPATGLPLRSFPRAGTTPTWASVTSIAWSPDGRSIASVSHNGVILLLDPANGKVSRTLQDLSRVDWGVPSAVAWSPDGRTLAASTWDRLGLRPPPVRVIRLWSAATGELQRAISSSNSAVYSVAWSPDGRFLATGGSEPIKIWDAFGGTNLRTMENSRSENGIAWSPDGAFLASAEDRTVRVWDATSGHAVRDMQGHQDSVSSVTWSPDGNFVGGPEWQIDRYVLWPQE
jgi:WD40 repeat protein